MTPAGKKILPAFMLSSKTSADNQVGAKGESHDLPYESLLFFLFFFLFFLVFTLFSNPRHGYKAIWQHSSVWDRFTTSTLWRVPLPTRNKWELFFLFHDFHTMKVQWLCSRFVSFWRSLSTMAHRRQHKSRYNYYHLLVFIASPQCTTDHTYTFEKHRYHQTSSHLGTSISHRNY